MKSTHATAAGNIKKELQAAFPGIKFSVKSKSFSMGDDVTVNWELGPTSKEVDAIIGKYEMGSFDGMQDLYEYDHDPNREAFRKSHGETKYAMANRHVPDYVYDLIIRELCQRQGIPFEGAIHNINIMGEWATTWVHRIMGKTSLPAGAVITGLSKTDVTCGRWEDFFNVEYKTAA